jgi:hypothetical protein
MKHLKLLFCVVLLVGHPAVLSAEVIVGVLIDGPWEHNTEITRTFEQEIVELTGREFEVVLPPSKQVMGDWSIGSVSRGLDQLLSDPDVDLIITAGVLGSNEAGDCSIRD